MNSHLHIVCALDGRLPGPQPSSAASQNCRWRGGKYRDNPKMYSCGFTGRRIVVDGVCSKAESVQYIRAGGN